MSKNFAVIGLGRFGSSVARALCDFGHEVLAVDIDPTRVGLIKDDVTHAVEADTTDERALAQLGIRNYDCVIVSVGVDIRASILTTVLCREQGAKYIVAKASDTLHAKLLTKTGADKVILPEHESAIRLARTLVSADILDYLELSDEYSVTETRIPLSWVGRSLVELNARQQYGASVIAIQRAGSVLISFDPAAPLEAGDVLVIIGANRDLDHIADMKS